jgi:hypothetical protein
LENEEAAAAATAAVIRFLVVPMMRHSSGNSICCLFLITALTTLRVWFTSWNKKLTTTALGGIGKPVVKNLHVSNKHSDKMFKLDNIK